MNDLTKEIVPELNFDNKARILSLTIGKFDSGYVVRNVFPKKTVALTSSGDIMGMAAQIAEAIYSEVKKILDTDKKAVTINIQILDKQIGIIPLGFDSVNDNTMLAKLVATLQPLFGGNIASKHEPRGFKDMFVEAEQNLSNKPIVNPTLFDGLPQYFGGFNPFFIIEEDKPVADEDVEDKGRVIKSTQPQTKRTQNGDTTRLEG